MSTDKTALRSFAPAKVNLTLHVTGRREDGYHLLDSMVVFADVGDWIEVAAGQGPSFDVRGPEGAGLTPGPDNLVLRAAALFDGVAGAAFRLKKILPVAAGIGGGSADAAAATRAILALQDGAMPADLDARLLELGADIPVCMASAPARMQGVGDLLTPLKVPLLHGILVNPRVAVSTPEVFRGLDSKNNAPMRQTPPQDAGVCAWTAWLGQQRNDLEAPARAVAPVIGKTLDLIRQTQDCTLARMSGSGATCFGLYPHAAAAKRAAAQISDRHPDWWVTATQMGDMARRAQPRVS